MLGDDRLSKNIEHQCLVYLQEEVAAYVRLRQLPLLMQLGHGGHRFTRIYQDPSGPAYTSDS